MNEKSQFIDLNVTKHPLTEMLHKQPYQMCTRTVMDTSDPEISFDAEGVCNHVKKFEYWDQNQRLIGKRAELHLEAIVEKLRKAGRGKDYDCIMGLSGGVDSSYMSYFVTKVLGLRALVVHVDTGWNSELAVMNIQSIVQKLNLDLHTLVIDWDEMRDLQLAYFKSGIANLDVPQDHCFIASLYQEAKKYGIKHIMNGGNMATESILPSAWGYSASDSWNLKAIHAAYGTGSLANYPSVGFWKLNLVLPYVQGMETIRPLEYIEYNKAKVKAFLMEELGWRDYGGKHYESVFTKFFQAHYLPTRFGYDKRKAHLSSLIVSGQLSRDEAIEELKKPLYDPQELEQDKIYFTKKLGITLEEFEFILQKPIVHYTNFKNQVDANKKLSNVISRLARIKRSMK
jgi:N-acetyl sugar amidotransferase